MPLDDTLFSAIEAVVGPKGLVTDAAEMAPYLEEERGLYEGQAALVVRPASTDEMAAVVKLCAAAGIAMVPQGGNTGLCGGSVPAEHGQDIILSTSRMNQIRAIDPIEFTMTVDAGVVLKTIQDTAAEQDCFFPLSLGAEGTCQIGGNIATNAGGINVLKYGNTRELVLGLEMVLPDGTVWHGLKALGKDNTGYALKQLMIGAEGTLGIITGAVLKLFPKPVETATAFCALDDVHNVTKLLRTARALSGDAVSAFELVSRFGLEITAKHIDGVSDPLESEYPWYVLIEYSTSRPNADLRGAFEQMLENAFEDGTIVDAVIAESEAQSQALWRMRESLPEAQKYEGGSIKHDVSVPVSRVPEFLDRALAAVTEQFPGVRPCPFGHVGDGNIHFNISQPLDADKAAHITRWEEMNRVVHDIVVDMEGSISAEHGVGRLKVEELKHYKQPIELDLMRRIKTAIDPANLMNPGKVVD